MIEGTFNENLLSKISANFASKQSKAIDDAIFSAIPKWKGDLIKKYKSKLLARILGINVDIEYRDSLTNFGKEIFIKLNGKIVRRITFSIKEDI